MPAAFERDELFRRLVGCTSGSSSDGSSIALTESGGARSLATGGGGLLVRGCVFLLVGMDGLAPTIDDGLLSTDTSETEVLRGGGLLGGDNTGTGLLEGLGAWLRTV